MSHPFDGMRYSFEHRPKVRKVDDRKQQRDHPKYVLVCEHGQKAQYGDDFVLHFLRLACDVLREVVEPQKKHAKCNRHNQQQHRCDEQKNVGLTWLGYKPRQVFGGECVGLIHVCELSHIVSQLNAEAADSGLSERRGSF